MSLVNTPENIIFRTLKNSISVSRLLNVRKKKEAYIIWDFGLMSIK